MFSQMIFLHAKQQEFIDSSLLSHAVGIATAIENCSTMVSRSHFMGKTTYHHQSDSCHFDNSLQVSCFRFPDINFLCSYAKGLVNFYLNLQKIV